MCAIRVAAVLALALYGQEAKAQVCNKLAATNVVFTNFTPFGGGVAATATISYHCKNGVGAAWIGLSSPRVMSSAGGTLQFELFQDAARTAIWPEIPPLVPIPPARNGSVTVYAFLPAQDVAAGLYQGSVVATIYANGQDNATDSTTVTVQASVAGSCVINPATLSFGNYDPLGASAASPLDGQATIQIACTSNTTYAVALGGGGDPAGAMRQMANGAYRLQYQLYSDAARSNVWDSTSTVGGVATSAAPVPLNVYGRIPAGQVVGAGAYQDVVLSTITF